MTLCLLVRCDGAREWVDWPHAEVARRLGGAVTFVGMDGLHVAVGLAEAEHLPVNAHLPPAWVFAPPARGDVVVVASDEDGEEMDADRAALAGFGE